ncbi:tail fiber protein [Escherichia coli]
MKCNGSSFNLTSYPALAAVFPSGVLPDLRGEFIRGWDDGRGVDTGRVLLSSQGDAIRNITAGDIRVMRTGANNTAPTGAFSSAADNLVTSVGPGGSVPLYSVGFDASRVVPTANENRPRNIAFNYIVRAA